MKKVKRLRMPFEEDSNKSAQMSNEKSSNDTLGVRTTGRIKKPKAVFDPSDHWSRSHRTPNVSPIGSVNSAPNALASRKRESSIETVSPPSPSLDSVDFCDVCNKREAKRGAHARNKFVTCLQCKKCVHKLCLTQEFDDFDYLRQKYKCEDCCVCSICSAKLKPNKNNDLITCTKCVKSFHLICHSPALNVANFRLPHSRRNWKCSSCAVASKRAVSELSDQTSIEQAKSEVNSSTAEDNEQNENTLCDLPIPIKSESIASSHGTNMHTNNNSFGTNGINNKANGEVLVKNSEVATSNGNYNILLDPIDLPDVKDWSIDQVVDFMSLYFPNEAHVFKEHEIDGESLLLMKRSDVVKKLSIKLGPSLRMYSLILKLQTQKNDATLGWNVMV